MSSDATAVVVGGGVAGLVTARRLAERGSDVTLLEREDGLGGRVRSTRRDGYVLDRGFQVLFTAYPAARRELDYGALDLRRFRPGAWIARDGRRSLLADPIRDPGALLESLSTREVTVADKLRALSLRRRLGSPDPDAFDGPDASIREYLRGRGFTERFVERFAAPFYGGITLDRSLSTSGRVFEYTFAMLAAGDAAVPAAGMGAIPEQLGERARAAGVEIETGRAVTALHADGEGATVETGDEAVEADAVVVATDPGTARELTGVDAIPTEGVGCVTQFYRLPAAKSLRTGRRLVLNADGAEPNHVVDYTAVAPEYSPDDERLVAAVFLGDPPSDDVELAERTREALVGWYPEMSFGDLERVHTERIPFAQFAQPPGIHGRLPDVDDPAGRAYLAGEYTAWSSIQGALSSGREAARAVRSDLG